MGQTSALTHVLERNKKLQALAATGNLPENVLARLSDTCLKPYVTDLKNNVHRDGLDAQYSKKEIWVPESSFYKKTSFKPQGKNGFKGERIIESTKIKFNKKTQKIESLGLERKVQKFKPKTMYLAEGYSEFREVQDLRTDKVNLDVSSDLRNSVGSSNTTNGHLIGITEASQVGKYLGNLDRFGTGEGENKRLYVATTQQRKDLHERISNEVHLITIESMKN